MRKERKIPTHTEMTAVNAAKKSVPLKLFAI
jgi:hypothetical protein